MLETNRRLDFAIGMCDHGLPRSHAEYGEFEVACRRRKRHVLERHAGILRQGGPVAGVTSTTHLTPFTGGRPGPCPRRHAASGRRDVGWSVAVAIKRLSFFGVVLALAMAADPRACNASESPSRAEPADAVWMFELGVGHSELDPSRGSDDGDQFHLAIRGGARLVIPQGRFASITLGALLEELGSTNDSETRSQEVRITYVTLPLLVGVSVPGPGVQPYLEAGPALSFPVTAHASAEARGEASPFRADWDPRDVGAVPMDVSARLEAGVALTTATNRYTLGLGYLRGYRDISISSRLAGGSGFNLRDLHNRCVYVTLAVGR